MVGKELHITGRRKEMILVRGRKLYPTDIESTVEDLARGHHFYRAGGTVAFGGDASGDERLFVAVEIERRQAARRDDRIAPVGGGDLPVGKDRRGPDRRRRPFDYRDAPSAHQTLPEIARAVRAAVAAEHGVEPYGVYLLRPGSVPKTSSGKKQRVLLGSGLLAESLGKDVLFTWRADRVATTTLREVA
jgi:acyl-CoA synthetase (AMP-forming)/AMP-acid ligase II